MKKITLFIVSLLTVGLTSCAHLSSSTEVSTSSVQNSSSLVADNSIWQTGTQTTWNKLQYIPLKTLEATQPNDPTMAGWIKLAIISKRYSTNTPELTQQLIAWRQQYSNHPANSLFPNDNTLETLQKQPGPQHVALLLPLDGKYGTSGRAVREGFLSAYYKNKSNTRISFYDTSKNSDILALYQQAINEGADTVIGPLLKENVQTLINQGNINVATLTLNYTELGFGSLPNNLYEFGLSPNDEAKQLANKAKEAGLSKALLIAPKTEWGEKTAKTLSAEWESQGGSVVDTLFFDARSNFSQDIPRLLHIDPKADREQTRSDNNKQNLAQQRRQDFNVIFLLAPPTEARQIVPLLRYYYVENTPIYSTSVIYSGRPSPQKDSDLNGIIFADTPWTLRVSDAGGSGLYANRLYGVGRDAYLLSQNLNRLAQLNNFPIYGATGALSLTPQHQIYRRIAWAKFHDGRP